MSSSEAFVTLATNDAYALGAMVLAESIRQVGTKAKLVVLISNHLSDSIKQTLETSFDELIVVEELNSNDVEHLNLLSRPELGITFTKINCWLLEQYKKCVFLDSDCVVLRPIDDLFEREELSAACDAGWPDCFNSGVFVYRPSKETFRKLMNFASQENVSFDGGDQGLLNDFFSSWRTDDSSRHLPFTYNVTANAFYSYLPAVTRFRNDIHVVHFAGATKPWQLTYNPQNEQLSGNLTGQSDIQREFLLHWWRIMHQHVWPKLSNFNSRSNLNNQSNSNQQNFMGQYSGSLNYGNLTSNQGVEIGSAAHRRAWEAGHIDYFGRDSFSNIQEQLERNIAHLPQQYHPSQQKEITHEKTTIDDSHKSSTKQSSLPLQKITNLPENSSRVPPLSSVQQVPNGSINTKKESTLATIVKQTIIEEIPKITIAKPEKEPAPSTIVKQAIIEESPTITITKLGKESAPSTIVKQTVTEESPKITIAKLGKESTPSTIVKQTIIEESPKITIAKLGKESMPSTIVKQTVIEESPKITIAKLGKESTPLTIVKQTVIEESPKITIKQLENESTPSTAIHSSHTSESKWTVQSTIVTSYTQGVDEFTGPTVISKVVSETLASSSNDIPIKTSIKQKKDLTISSRNELTDNGTSARILTPASTNGNRVNK